MKDIYYHIRRLKLRQNRQTNYKFKKVIIILVSLLSAGILFLAYTTSNIFK